MPGFRRPLYRDDAVVLRVQKLGESDRIITLLTRRHGKVRAVARGVRRTTSRFGARLEPFGHVDVQLAGDPGTPGLHTVSQVEGIDLHGRRLVDDYPHYTAASAIAETAERLTPVEQEPAGPLFSLTLGALAALARRRHDSALVLDAYLLRAMAYAGWAPALAACALCGEAGPHAAFAVPAGGSVCVHCRPPGAVRPRPDTVALLVALAGGDWTRADAADPGARREASGLVAALLQWHLEKAMRSLPLVDRGQPRPPGRPYPGAVASGAVPGAGSGSAVAPPAAGAGVTPHRDAASPADRASPVSPLAPGPGEPA